DRTLASAHRYFNLGDLSDTALVKLVDAGQRSEELRRRQAEGGRNTAENQKTNPDTRLLKARERHARIRELIEKNRASPHPIPETEFDKTLVERFGLTLRHIHRIKARQQPKQSDT